MIIGDGIVLSPKEVRQMRRVPELVFINCCHLGCVESGEQRTPDKRNERSDYHKIAANVATEFINMGVRAVIAAGWAVDDLAAATFASVFYDEMLTGSRFGEAVQAARKATFDRHPGSNTWGAYQCYGDPDYSLVKPRRDKEEEIKFVSPSKAVSEIDNYTARLATRAGKNIDAEVRWQHNAVSLLEKKKWLDDGRIRAALGRAFGQAKLFEEAIAHYEQACGAEDAGMTLKDLEQLANLRIRWAVRLWPQGGSKKTDEIIRLIEAGKDLLDKIIQVCGSSSERLSLLGSAYKRLAWVRKEDRARSLAQMADQYREACAQAEKKKKRDPYALLNWLTAEIALDWQAQEQRPLPDRLPDFQDRLAQARMWVAAAFASKHIFWNEVMVADADLIEALSTGGLSKKQIEQLASKYRESRKRGSPREFESVLDQLDFLMAMAEASPPMAKALTTLRQRLREQSA